MKAFITTIVAVLILGCTTYQTYASGFNEAAGSRAVGVGNHFTTLSDVFSTYNNQAGIGFIKEFSFGIAARNKFILGDLNHFNAAAVFPTKTGTFGLNFSYYGLDIYNEKKVGISFGKSFGEKFSAGLQFDYINIFLDNYGTKHLFTFEVGLQFYILPQLLIGAHVNNPLRLDIDEESTEKYPTIMRFGLNYMPSKKVAIMAELEKDLDFSPVYKLGIEYKVIEKFVIRGGFNVNPFSGSLGVGLKLKTLSIDAASAYHPVLGFSPSLSLSYAIRKKK